MIYSYLSQLYVQIAQATARYQSTSPKLLSSALMLALVLGLNPVLTSTALHAQTAEQSAQLASVNINSADAETIADGLKGVGLSRAKEIIRYRESFGPFASVDELAEVKGVGLSTIDKNRAVITLE